MITHYLKKGTSFLALSAAMMLVASCSTDSNYDLSDVDTNARFEVNGLVLPINITPVTLETMLDIADDSKIKKETLADGSVIYSITESGSFDSEPIESDDFIVAGTLSSAMESLTFDAFPLSGYDFSADIPTDKTDTKVDVTSTDISSNLRSLESLGISTTARLTIDVNIGIATDVKITGLKINFLKGLTVGDITVNGNKYGSYDPTTGVLTFNELTANSIIDIPITRMTNNNYFTYRSTGSQFQIFEDITIASGGKIVGKTVGSVQPTQGYFTVSLDLQNIEIKSVTGEIAKEIDVDDIDPIELTDLPDMLKEAGTDIKLTDPKLTLKVNNPLVEKGYSNAIVQTGLKLTANGKSYSTNDGEIKAKKDNNDITISPNVTTSDNTVKFDGLKYILQDESGTKGMPDKIEVAVFNTQVPQTKITDYLLGSAGQLNAVHGEYTFYTPLSITADSKIKYAKDWDDWQDDDLDGLTITAAKVNMTVTNNVKLGIESIDFKIYGTDGSVMTGSQNINIAPGETKDVEIDMTGNVSKISGAKVDLHINGGDATLMPSQAMKLENLKATVTGYYDKKL